MSTFYLDSIDEFLVKQIAKKFSFHSGGRFYRSCRSAKNIVDGAKPHWLPPDLRYNLCMKPGDNGKPDHFLQVDLMTNSWRRLSLAVPYEAYAGGAAFLNEEFYVFGGSLPSTCNGCRLVYKLTKNLEWEQLPDMNEPRCEIRPSSVVFYGCIWIMGGLSEGSVVNSVEAYSPATNSWSNKPPMNYTRARGAAAVANGKIFICGGSLGLSSLEYYDSQLARWILCTDLPSSHSPYAAAARGSLLVVLADFPADRSCVVVSMDVEEANPQWSTVPPNALDGPHYSAAIVGGKLFLTAHDHVGEEPVNIFDGKRWTTGTKLQSHSLRMPYALISQELGQKLLSKYSH